MLHFDLRGTGLEIPLVKLGMYIFQINAVSL